MISRSFDGRLESVGKFKKFFGVETRSSVDVGVRIELAWYSWTLMH
jgi:hypothetical protein